MKKVSIFLAVAFVATALGFTGCASEDPAKPLEVDWNRTAVLKGTILINADISKVRADQKLSAPPTTFDKEAFIVSIPYSSLNSGASGTYILPKEKIVYRNGEFTITVPVGVSGSTVTVKIDDFAGTLKKTIGTDDKTVDVIWKPSAVVGTSGSSKTLSPGQTAYFDNWILDAYYTTTPPYYTEVKADGSSAQ